MCYYPSIRFTDSVRRVSHFLLHDADLLSLFVYKKSKHFGYCSHLTGGWQTCQVKTAGWFAAHGLKWSVPGCLKVPVHAYCKLINMKPRSWWWGKWWRIPEGTRGEVLARSSRKYLLSNQHGKRLTALILGIKKYLVQQFDLYFLSQAHCSWGDPNYTLSSSHDSLLAKKEIRLEG